MTIKVPELNLQGRVCVVTGASGGLGAGLARVLHHAGANVALLARSTGKLNEIASELEKTTGRRPAVLTADVTEESAVRAACEELKKTLGAPDILINGAGGNRKEATAEKTKVDTGAADPMLGSFFRLAPTAWSDVMNLNFMGVLIPSMIFGEAMATKSMASGAGQGGIIINISSMSALRPLTKVGAYSAAKAAMTNLTQWMAVHMAPANIRVNAIAPGFFSTEQNRFLLHGPDGKTLTPRAEQILAHTPMGRFGVADDLTGALLYLSSDWSRFVTGVVLPVDGGFSAYAGV